MKTTIYLDPPVLRATRVAAARAGKRESDVGEDALREYLGLAVIGRIRSRSNLEEGEAMRLAYYELHTMRRDRREARDERP